MRKKKLVKKIFQEIGGVLLLSVPAIGVLWFGLDMHLPVHAAEAHNIRQGVVTIQPCRIRDGVDTEAQAYYFTNEETEWLLKTAMAEAGNQGTIGQALVMRVILNRVEDGRFSPSIEGVITAPHQFSTYSNGSIAEAIPNEDSYEALLLIESGWDESQGALYFDSDGTGFGWTEHIFDYGAHHFYYH